MYDNTGLRFCQRRRPQNHCDPPTLSRPHPDTIVIAGTPSRRHSPRLSNGVAGEPAAQEGFMRRRRVMSGWVFAALHGAGSAGRLVAKFGGRMVAIAVLDANDVLA